MNIPKIVIMKNKNKIFNICKNQIHIIKFLDGPKFRRIRIKLKSQKPRKILERLKLK